MNKNGFVLITLFALTLINESMGQSFYAIKRQRDLIFSVGTGTSTYYGELQNPGDHFDAKPSLNIGAQFFPFHNLLENRISARAEVTWFRLQGNDNKADDIYRKKRNLSFFSNNWEVSTVGMLHLFPHDLHFYQRSSFNVYGFFGVGLLYMNPKTEYQGENVTLQPLQTEGVEYSRFQFVIPYGLGVKIKGGAFYNIALEGGWRKTFTDYLDDVSLYPYADPASLQSDLARALSDRRKEYNPDFVAQPGVGQRGNPDKKDSYMFINLKVEYFLPIQIKSNKLMTQPRRNYRRR